MQRYAIVLAIMVITAACGSDDGEATTTTVASTSTTVAATTADDVTDGRTPQDGDSVEVHYVGTLDDGSQFDSSRDRQEPFVFELGFDPPQVIAGFEEAVQGMEVGDVVTIRIPPEEAYGEVDEELIFTVPIEEAPEGVAVLDEVLVGGETPGVVTAVSATEVTIDLNHPFAGQALTFEIELLSIN